MKLSYELLATLGRPEFWAGWFQIDDEVELGNDKAIEVTAGDEQLILEIDAADLGIERDGIWFRVGYDIGGSYRGDLHALRWQEVELIGRAIALRGGPPHPGAMLALFARFAPITPADLARVPVIEAALVAAGAATHQVKTFINYINWSNGDVRWVRDEYGWLLEGKFVATVRRSSAMHDEPDLISLLDLQSNGAGWIERPELRGRVDRFFDRLTAEVSSLFDPAWRTPRVLALCDALGTDRAAGPVLADAFHEAGCQHQTILDGLREGAAWMVDLVRGRAVE